MEVTKRISKAASQNYPKENTQRLRNLGTFTLPILAEIEKLNTNFYTNPEYVFRIIIKISS